MRKTFVIIALLAATVTAAYGQADGAEARGDSCMDVHDTFHALTYYGEAQQIQSREEGTQRPEDQHPDSSLWTF